MKVEGLGERNNWFNAERLPTGINEIPMSTIREPIKPEELKIGMELNQGEHGGYENRYIVTDVLGDGKFKAVPKNYFEEENMLAGLKNRPEDFITNVREADKETFDISGTIDKENPIYKFYEKEVGKYLINKYGATKIKDPQGVQWWQIKVDPKLKNEPVGAFSLKQAQSSFA